VGLWGLSLAILVVILVFSWATKPPLSSFSLTDKIGHALAYAALAGTLLLAAVWRPGRGPGPFPRAAVLILGGAVVFGGIAELGQGLFFHRDASFRDLLIDGAGVLAAYAVWRLMERRLPTGAA
jgi:VanZ family protein